MTTFKHNYYGMFNKSVILNYLLIELYAFFSKINLLKVHYRSFSVYLQSGTRLELNGFKVISSHLGHLMTFPVSLMKTSE